jgi:hypothetical protein
VLGDMLMGETLGARRGHAGAVGAGENLESLFEMNKNNWTHLTAKSGLRGDRWRLPPHQGTRESARQTPCPGDPGRVHTRVHISASARGLRTRVATACGRLWVRGCVRVGRRSRTRWRRLHLHDSIEEHAVGGQR